jgi:adenosylcobinamide-phosphate synthase
MRPLSLNDPLLLLLVGLAFDALFGDLPLVFRFVPHPVALVGAAAAIGWVIQALCRGRPFGALIEAVLIGILVAARSLFLHVADVMLALRSGGLEAGLKAVGHIVGRDPARLDRHGVARAAIESLAENFSDGVVAPVFWYLVGGLPGLFAYKMANTLDSMIGHRSPRYRAFGWAAARFDDLANLLPARLSGLLLAAAALFVKKARPGRSLVAMLRDARRHRSPNAGWPEAAMAGALGLALAGPRHYADGIVDDPWIGGGTARATIADIGRALRLYSAACLLLSGGLIAAWIALHVRLPG